MLSQRNAEKTRWIVALLHILCSSQLECCYYNNRAIDLKIIDIIIKCKVKYNRGSYSLWNVHGYHHCNIYIYISHCVMQNVVFQVWTQWRLCWDKGPFCDPKCIKVFKLLLNFWLPSLAIICKTKLAWTLHWPEVFIRIWKLIHLLEL